MKAMATSTPAIRYHDSNLVRQVRQRAFVHDVNLPQLGHFIRIADFQLPIVDCQLSGQGQLAIGNRQLAMLRATRYRGGSDSGQLDA